MISQKSVPALRLTFLTCLHCTHNPKPHDADVVQLQGCVVHACVEGEGEELG